MGRAGRERERNIGGNKTTTHTLSLSPSCGLWVEFCISFLQFSGCSVATAWYSASLSSQSRRRNEGRKRMGAVVNQSRPLDSPLQLQFITLCLSLSIPPSSPFLLSPSSFRPKSTFSLIHGAREGMGKLFSRRSRP